MKIKAGDYVKGFAPVAGNSVRFDNDEGQTMFEVRVGEDGKTLEIRGIENCVLGGQLHANRLVILPDVANVVRVTVPPYGENW